MCVPGAGPSGLLCSNQVSCTSDVETESRSHDAVETSGEVIERSAKKSAAVHRARAKAERTWKCTCTAIGLETQ